MSSTHTHSDHLDRKALKTPDGFLTVTSRFFDQLAKNSRNVGVIGGLLLIVLALGALLSSRQATRSIEARNSFFLAEKTFEKELKILAAASAPKTAEPAPASAPPASKQSKDKEEAASLEAVLYQKLDVDARFHETVAQLKSVSEKYAGTRSAYEAQLTLGRLYADHGDSARALPWFVHALGSAPNQNERIHAGLAVGRAQEDLGKYAEAVQDYEAAAKLAEGSLQAEALLSLARTFELMRDAGKARSVYDQIITTMAGTEYAKTAELRKSQVE